jgi:hypothetical protein
LIKLDIHTGVNVYLPRVERKTRGGVEEEIFGPKEDQLHNILEE